jgi:hypothetical protein
LLGAITRGCFFCKGNDNLLRAPEITFITANWPSGPAPKAISGIIGNFGRTRDNHDADGPGANRDCSLAELVALDRPKARLVATVGLAEGWAMESPRAARGATAVPATPKKPKEWKKPKK